MSIQSDSVHLLLAFDQAISWPDTPRVTTEALNFFRARFGFDRSSIALLGGNGKPLNLFTLDNSIPGLSANNDLLLTKDMPLRLSPKKEPHYQTDLLLKKGASTLEKKLSSAGIQSYFYIPLLIGNSVVGSLNLGSKQSDGIDISTRETMVLLSARLALALYHATLHDDLKEKEQALAVSEKNYRELIDQAGDAIIKGSLIGDILQTNEAASNLFGYSQDELLSMNYSDLFTKQMLEQKPLRYDLIQEGLTVITERSVVRKDGISVTIEMNSKKLIDGTIVSVFRDLTERKETHEKLLARENQIKALLDAVPAPLYAKDQKGRYILLNDAYLKFFGRKSGEMLGKTLRECWPEDVARRFEEDDRIFLESGERQSYPVVLTNSRGEARQTQVNKAKYLDAKGEVAGFIGTLWDYTELKAAEDRYQSLYANAPDPIVVHDGKTVLTANQAATNFFKAADPEKYLGAPLSVFVHPDSLKNAKERIKKLFTTNQPNQAEEQKFIIATGEVRDVKVTSVIIEYGGRRVVMTSFRDITEEKHHQDLLQASEENYRNLIESTPNPVVVHVDGRIVYANKAARYFAEGDSSSDYIGKSVYSYVHKDSVKKARENALFTQNTGQPTPVGEQKYINAAGEIRHVESRGVPIIYEGQKAIMVSFVDTTEKFEARLALQESRQQLELITDNVTHFIVLLDFKLNILYANRACSNWFNLKKDKIVGKNLGDLFVPDAVDATKANFNMVLLGETRRFSYAFVSQASGAFEFWTTLIPVYSAENEIVAVLAQTEDITERKQNEVFREALRKLARELTVSLTPHEIGPIASSSLYGLFAYDAFILYKIDLERESSVVLYAEDTSFNGNRPAEVEIRTTPLDIHDKHSVMILARPLLINRTSDSKTPLTPFGDTTRKSKSLVFVPIFWGGKQIGLFSVQSYTLNRFGEDDVAKLKIFADQIGGALARAQTDSRLLLKTETLLEREQQLEASVGEKEVLLKEIYHRTKNNMQVIIGLLEMRGYKTKNRETHTVLREMVDQIYSMSMVHDLLYRSKNLAEINLDVYLEKLITRLIAAYQTSSSEISLEFKADSIPINIQIAIPLGLVINEVVSNALKYAFPDDRDGQISLSAQRGDRGLDLKIGDNGIGINPGFRLDQSETLGMRIIQDVVELQLFGELGMTTIDGVEYSIRIPELTFE